MNSSRERDESGRDREELREVAKRGGRAAYQLDTPVDAPFTAEMGDAEAAGLPGDLRRAAFHQELAAREVAHTEMA